MPEVPTRELGRTGGPPEVRSGIGASVPGSHYNAEEMGADRATPLDHDRLAREVDALVDECRGAHLWYQRADWYPRTDEERIRTLDAIQRRANLDVFRRAGTLKARLTGR